jgi:hypothetical protein
MAIVFETQEEFERAVMEVVKESLLVYVNLDTKDVGDYYTYEKGYYVESVDIQSKLDYEEFK